MTRISFTEQGVVTQYELAKILILTSDGLIEVTLPLTDDERRDMELHIRGKFARALALQVKSTMHLVRRFKAYQLSMFFSVPKDKLITHPNFYYFFGYFDKVAMTFAEPVFIVPSAEVHAHAAPRLDGDRWTFNFSASLAPDSQDHWVPFRVLRKDVGRRVVEILSEPQLKSAGQPLPAEIAYIDGLMLIGSSRAPDTPA